MLFKRKPREVPQPEPEPPPRATGDAALRDDIGLHQLWYLQQRLQEEVARSARSEAIFSVAAWEPRLLPSDEPDPKMIAAAGRMVVDKLRPYDLAAFLTETRIIGLLLDADYHQSATVTFRLKTDIQLEVPGAGKWKAGLASFGRDGVDAESLLQTAIRRMEDVAGLEAA
jgi:hypothetical protein